VQARLSRIPREDELLIEVCRTPEGHHCTIFPFEGQLVHAGLAALLSLRLSRLQHGVFALAANDYGLELVDERPYPYEKLVSADLFSNVNLADDAIQSASMSFLARRQFREIARVAGLVFQTFPGPARAGGSCRPVPPCC
jgi:ATP-dependent Lhr-like helicase